MKLATTLLSLTMVHPQLSAQELDVAGARAQVLELGKLIDAPKVYPADGFKAAGLIKPLFYDGLTWKGKPTRVFAWMGMPENPKGKVPGVVLVHGGGGTAFKEWVKRWNDHGYAAVSIAVEGQVDIKPKKKTQGVHWVSHEWGGPARTGIYGDSQEALTDQWMYHAVGQTVLANSLLRAQEGVDTAKVGVMGISWGGVITSTVIGIDNRFAFGIPTYGCGALSTAANQYGRSLGNNPIYTQIWDPMVRMKNATMPTLWYSWPGDKHFPLDAQATSYQAATGPVQVLLRPGMRHGHGPGWTHEDSYVFADSITKSNGPWCEQTASKTEENQTTLTFRTTREITKATLHFSTETGFTGMRTFQTQPLEFKRDGETLTVTVPVPENSTGWFVNLTKGKLIATSHYHGHKP